MLFYTKDECTFKNILFGWPEDSFGFFHNTLWNIGTLWNILKTLWNILNILYWSIVFSFFSILSFWSIVDKPWCVSYRYTARWFSNTHTSIHSFSNCFPIPVITEYRAKLPMLYNRSWLAICFKYNSVYMSISSSYPHSHPCPHPSHNGYTYIDTS